MNSLLPPSGMFIAKTGLFSDKVGRSEHDHLCGGRGKKKLTEDFVEIMSVHAVPETTK
jgi:hypothetical protein